jgi:hypothetical protein
MTRASKNTWFISSFLGQALCLNLWFLNGARDVSQKRWFLEHSPLPLKKDLLTVVELLHLFTCFRMIPYERACLF